MARDPEYAVKKRARKNPDRRARDAKRRHEAELAERAARAAVRLDLAIDAAIRDWHYPSAIREAARARLERAVEAVHLKEERPVGFQRLDEIAALVATRAYRDWRAGLLERPCPPAPPAPAATKTKRAARADRTRHTRPEQHAL